MSPNKLKSAYLAGLIDGEGYIGILEIKKGNKSSWHCSNNKMYIPVLKVAMTDKEIITWLYKSFGGTFETRKRHGKARESYCWAMRKKQVITFLKKIYPFMRVKKKQVEVLLRFPSNKTGQKMTDDVYEKRKSLCEEIRKLNKRGAA